MKDLKTRYEEAINDIERSLETASTAEQVKLNYEKAIYKRFIEELAKAPDPMQTIINKMAELQEFVVGDISFIVVDGTAWLREENMRAGTDHKWNTYIYQKKYISSEIIKVLDKLISEAKNG